MKSSKRTPDPRVRSRLDEYNNRARKRARDDARRAARRAKHAAQGRTR